MRGFLSYFCIMLVATPCRVALPRNLEPCGAQWGEQEGSPGEAADPLPLGLPFPCCFRQKVKEKRRAEGDQSQQQGFLAGLSPALLSRAAGSTPSYTSSVLAL